MSAPASYLAPQPPRRRRGVKRLIFGILGILANGIGIFVMPFVAGLIAVLITIIWATDLTPLENGELTFDAKYWGIYSIAVPASDLDQVSCQIDGEDIVVSPGDASYSIGQVDGVDYVELYAISADSDQQVSVQCEGFESIAFYEAGVTGATIGVGLGLVLPIVLGLLSLALTIWGAIALFRSS